MTRLYVSSVAGRARRTVPFCKNEDVPKVKTLSKKHKSGVRRSIGADPKGIARQINCPGECRGAWGLLWQLEGPLTWLCRIGCAF